MEVIITIHHLTEDAWIPLYLRKQRSLHHGIFRLVFGKTASLIRPDLEEAVYVEWIELEGLHRAVKAERW